MTEAEEKFIRSFLSGTSHTSYAFFGVHEQNGEFVFRVFAPNATSVMLTGDFNGWRDDIALKKIHECGIWEADIPYGRISYGDRYKYRIYGCGQLQYKSDPYSLALSPSPDNSSVVCKSSSYCWKDSGWLTYRPKYQKNIASKPLNIYEVHLGSWKRYGRGGLNYREYAKELAPYVKQMGYTHVCLLPIAEAFDDNKLDYAPSSFFAPTSKYGSPNDLKGFVDKLHEAGVGVIFDIPIARFPTERYGLYEFDGDRLYERDTDEHRRHFDLTKNTVKSFLLSSISYWVSEYHVDAIRISDVDELLHFYGADGKFTDEKNIAKSFLQELTRTLKKIYPDVLLLAERAGLDMGFDVVFDGEWSERLLEYSATDFSERAKISRAIARNIVSNNSGTLSIPHVDPKLCKNSLIETMTGDYWQKFAGVRALWGLTMTARGKKLSFMGNEIAQFKSWRFERELEWFLLDFDSHEKLQRYVAELNNLYLSHPALWQRDASSESLCFVSEDPLEQDILIFRRSARDEELLVVVNLSPIAYEEYRIGAHVSGVLKEIFNSDELKYYGGGIINNGEIEIQKIAYHGYENSFVMRIPPLAISVLAFNKNKKK